MRIIIIIMRIKKLSIKKDKKEITFIIDFIYKNKKKINFL